MTSQLLIEEPPLQVLPSLAVAIGLNEAIFVQQLHYWMKDDKWGKEHDGRRWIRNTKEEWQAQFPFWSVDTIKRTITSLKSSGIVLMSTSLNKMAIDHTGWYTIDYDALYGRAKTTDDQGNMHRPSVQYAPNDQGNLHPTITRDYPETTDQRYSPPNPPSGKGNVTPKQAPRKPSNLTDSGSRKESKQPQVSAPPPAELVRFISCYPSHRSGGNSIELREAWEMATSEVSAKRLFEILERHKDSWKWTNEPQYVPGIVKWLSEGRWKAEPEPAPYTPPPAPGHLHPREGQNTMIWGVDY